MKDKKLKTSKNSINKNDIIINPRLEEETTKKVVLAFGRMNPPTIGHEKLVNKVKELARKDDAIAEIYLSHSEDAKKNPLTYDDKLMIAKEAFGSVVKQSSAKDIIGVLKSIQDRYDDVTLVVGQDRMAEFTALLDKYNGKEYSFKSIKVISAGERDPDADGIEGVSSSKMREAASKGEVEKFKSGLPKNLKPHSDDVYDMVRAGMKLSEDVKLDEYVLTIAQRNKRAIVMRRYERKMETARARMKKRIADNQHLLGRARKKAIEIIRRKVAGDKGLEYQNLSPSEKMMIDQRVEKRKGAIAKIAARLLPSVRKAELQRVALLSKGGQAGTGKQTGTPVMREDVNSIFESYLGESKRYHMAFGKDGRPKYDRRFKAFRHIVKNEETELLNIVESLHNIADKISLEEAKSLSALTEKAEKSGIPLDVILKVYEEGVQFGNPFDHVNAFIANNLFEDFINEGVNDPSIFKAVFLAGGPGSGKSFIVGKTALTALGMKVINSDDVFERALAKAGLKTTPEDIYSPKGQQIRGEAKALTSKKQDLALMGRLGLVIDGTGKDYTKIEKQASQLKKLGYEVAMIFVNTDLDTAKARNRARARSLPDSEVEAMWVDVQKNIGKFQQFFGNRMFIIDNSEGSNFESAVNSTYKKISAWAKVLPSNPEAKNWISQSRSIKESVALGRSKIGDIIIPQVPAAVIPPAPDDVNTKDEVDSHIERNSSAALTRANKMKKFRAYHEEFGAGFEGTDELVQNYKAVTPGEKGTPKKPKISDRSPLIKNVNEEFEALMEVEGSIKNNRQLLATGRITKDEFDRRMGYGKYKKKGSAGVGPLGKTLYKNLVKSAVEEETILNEAEDEPEITAAQMKEFEKFVDRMFEKFKIDFEFTRHFGERMNDDRNTPKIKLKELAALIKKIYNKHGNPLKDNPGAEMVVKDLQSDLNMPVVVKYDSKNDEIDVVAKTIMRKRNFSTPNPVVKY